MANLKTSIEWTDMTWNPTSGCSKVSQGCKHCYAERIFARPYPGRKFTDVRTHANRLAQPLQWKKSRRVFVNSMSDIFHEAIADEFIDHVFAAMALAKQHTFQVLTKRPERMLRYIRGADGREIRIDFGPGRIMEPFDWPLPNVQLGVSVENQEAANERIPLLLHTPATVRFLSMEPLLAHVDLNNFLYVPTICQSCGYHTAYYDTNPHNLPTIKSPVTGEGTCLMGAELTGEPGGIRCADCHSLEVEELSPINWVIVGGESGPKARSMNLDWARSIRDQCKAAEVPFFMKQTSQRDSKTYSDLSSFPPDLQIREFPTQKSTL